MGSVGGAGKVSVQDITVAKWLDRSSPILMLSCCSGKHFSQAVLTMRKAGGKPLEYMTLTMKDLIVTSVSLQAAAGAELQTEIITINFSEFKTEYKPQNADGSGAAGIEVAWNIAQNIVV